MVRSTTPSQVSIYLLHKTDLDRRDTPPLAMSDVGSQLLRTTDSKPLLSLPCKTYGTSSIAHASKASHGVPTLGAVHLADEDGSVIDDMDVAFDDRQPMKPAAFYKL